MKKAKVKNYTEIFQLKLTEAQSNKLERLAKEYKCSQSEVVRKLIQGAAEQAKLL